MAKRKRKQKNGIHGERVATPEVVLPTPEFATKNALESVKTDQGSRTLRVRDKRPIDAYHRLYCIDEERGLGEAYRRGISEDQYRAADRLACNYEHCHPGGGRALVSVRVQSSVNVGLFPNEAITHAIHQHMRWLRDLSPVSQAIVEAVCCREESLTEFEQARHWRKGYGMTRLREALDELTEVFRAFGKAKRQG